MTTPAGPSALIILAPGAEEIETITVADLLVRAGVRVTLASTAAVTVVAGSRGLTLGAQTLLDLVTGDFDLLYLPGGLGSAQTCRDDPRIQARADAQLASGRLLAAICAAPIALVPRRLCAGRHVTSHPGSRAEVEPHARAWLARPVVEDGNLITSMAAGTSLHLGLALIRRLVSPAKAVEVGQAILVEATTLSHASSTTSAEATHA